MLSFLASDTKRWISWFTDLQPEVSKSANKYLNDSKNLSVTTMHFYNSFPGMYVAKCKDILRKNNVLEEEVHGKVGKWRSEAEDFLVRWLAALKTKLAPGESIDSSYKRKLPSSLPIDSTSFGGSLENGSFKQQKIQLNGIIKQYIPNWIEIIQKRMRVIKILADAAREVQADGLASQASGSK